MGGGTTVTMGANFLAVLSQIWSSMGDVVDTILDKPLLLIPVGFGFAGGAIGLARGLMGTRRRRR